jgi:tetratricopeptide (TPR) repeat protein
MNSNLAQPEAAPALPGQAQSLLDGAYAYDEQGLFEQALQACEAALQLDPACAEAHNLRGLLLDELGQREAAIGAFETALRLDPAFDDAAWNLAEVERQWARGRQQARRSALPETRSEQGDLTTVARFSFPVEAYLARTRLEWAGIPAFVADDRTVMANWLYSNAIGGVRLRVRECDVETAREILSSMDHDSLEDDGATQDEFLEPLSDHEWLYHKRWAFRLFCVALLALELLFILSLIL